MNEGLEKIKERLEETKVDYDEVENCIAINDLNEELGIVMRYVIAIAETEPHEYIIKVIVGNITKVNNEQEILKIINKINYNSLLVTYTESDDKSINAKIMSMSRLDTIAYDVVSMLLILRNDITENYKELMKSNWSEEVL